MRGMSGPWPPILAAVAAFGCAALVRGWGFDAGVLVGATPASAVALAAAVTLRWRGGLAAGAGIAAAGLAFGLPATAAAADGAAHGLAALVGAGVMRTLARRREERSRTSDWLIFLAGVVAFTLVTSLGLLAGIGVGALPPTIDPALALAFEPMGLMTFGAVLASLREWPEVRADPRPALGTAALGLGLLAALWLVLQLQSGAHSPSAVALLLSMPLCLWVAMQRRSLDGAALSFAAASLLLAMLLVETGSILSPDYVRSVVYLSLLVAACQLVHAVNRDRLAALAEVERRKRELEARVAERTARLSAATEAALAADAAKTRFVAMVAHEVRTPLNGVLGMAALVLDGPLEPGVRRNVGIIRTSGLHLLDVINRLLDFTRLDRPLRSSDFGPLDLGDLVDEVLSEARGLPYAEGIDIEAEIDPALALRRRGYRQGLRQILTNLVGNAAKFTDRGSVTVRLRRLARDGVRVEVVDTGIGMSAAAQERVFLPYERVDEASAGRYGGTGLGLSICAEIVERLGGRIGVESSPGVGSTFWFELDMPLVPAAASSEGVRGRSALRAQASRVLEIKR